MEYFFLNSSNGTDQTCSYLTFCYHFWAESTIVIYVAGLSGAALFLLGSKRSNTKFKIMIDIIKLNIWHIWKKSIVSKLLKKTALNVEYEVLMKHNYWFAATFCPIGNIKVNNEFHFDEIPMLLGGNFAQTTPVLTEHSKTKTVNTSIWNWIH